MPDPLLGAIAFSLAAACILAAVVARRPGSSGRDIRLVTGIGAALGGGALLWFASAS